MAGKVAERVYVIENTSSGSKRLVQAKSQAAALKHVVENTFEVRVVNTVEMGELIGKYKVQLEKVDAESVVVPPSALPGGGDLVDSVASPKVEYPLADNPHVNPHVNSLGENTDPNAGLPFG